MIKGPSDTHLEKLARASRQAAVLSVLGFLVVVGALGYAAFKLHQLERERQRLDDSIAKLNFQTQELRQTQEGLLDFLGKVTASEQIRLIDPSIDWERTKGYLVQMEAGPRKTAILSAILLAWKELPFSVKNYGLGHGLDSPHFINTVLSRVGVQVEAERDDRLSDAMMQRFDRVDSPLPGDLIFYRGDLGSFVVMYIAPGSPEGKGVAVGTLQKGEEVQVLDTAKINTPAHPFIGFFRVPYPPSATYH